jgi:hypothetical protein
VVFSPTYGTRCEGVLYRNGVEKVFLRGSTASEGGSSVHGDPAAIGAGRQRLHGPVMGTRDTFPHADPTMPKRERESTWDFT